MNAIDTNVLVYSWDSDEVVKQAKATDLISQLLTNHVPTVLPWQVTGEFLNWLQKWEKAGRATHAQVVDHFRDLLALFRVVYPTRGLYPHYFSLRG